ncbi:hypothetical protein GCM10010464_09520 [Pseudonocardia yunnanensis]
MEPHSSRPTGAPIRARDRRPPDALSAAGVRIFSSTATSDEPAVTGTTAGRLTAPAPDRLGVSADAAAYGCGPAPFIAEAHSALDAAGCLSTCLPPRTGPRMPGVTISPRW